MLQTFKHSGLTIYYFFRNLNIFNKHTLAYSCTINSKINGTAKGVYLPISKLLWARKFATAKIECSFKLGKANKHFWGYHLFCCLWYTQYSIFFEVSHPSHL